MTGVRVRLAISIGAVLAVASAFRVAGAVQAVYLGDDRTTQGDWTGRYGGMQYVLWAMKDDRSDIVGGPQQVLTLGYRTADPDWKPIHYLTPGGGRSTDPRFLVNPQARKRTMGELNDWTDHYPEDPPDLFIELGLPQSWYLLSIYWVNNDFHNRHYRLRLATPKGDLLAECKVDDFDEGVYTRFAVKGEPGNSALVVHITCEQGDLIKLSGLFLDEVRLPEPCPIDLGPDNRNRGREHSRPEQLFAGMAALWARDPDAYFQAYDRYPAAARLLEKAAEASDPHDLWELWPCQRAAGDWRAAERTLARFASVVVDSLGAEKGLAALDGLARRFDEQEEPRLAAVVLDQRLRRSEDSAAVQAKYEELAGRWLALCEDLAAADAFARLVALELPADRLLRLHYKLARIYEEWERPGQAEQWYRQLAARFPGSSEGRAAGRRIYGLISEKGSHLRVGDADITLRRHGPEPPAGAFYDSWPVTLHARSDVDGSYQVRHVPPGRYRWEISAPGYYSYASPTFEIADDDASKRVDLELEKRRLLRGQIRMANPGRWGPRTVRWAEGTLAFSPSGRTIRFMTEGNGLYAVDLPQEMKGNVTIRLRVEGYGIAVLPDVTVGERDLELDFAVEHTPPVAGKVVDAETNRGIEGAEVRFYWVDRWPDGGVTQTRLARVTAEEEGEFSAHDFWSGQYAVVVRPPRGYQEARLEIEIQADRQPAPIVFKLHRQP